MANVRVDPNDVDLTDTSWAGHTVNLNGFMIKLRRDQNIPGMDLVLPRNIVRYETTWHVGLHHSTGYFQRTISDRQRTIQESLDEAWNVLLKATDDYLPRDTRPSSAKPSGNRIPELDTGVQGVMVLARWWGETSYLVVEVHQKIFSGADECAHRRRIGSVTYSRYLNDPEGAKRDLFKVLAKATSIRLYSNHLRGIGDIPQKPIHYENVPKKHRLKKPYQHFDVEKAFEFLEHKLEQKKME